MIRIAATTIPVLLLLVACATSRESAELAPADDPSIAATDSIEAREIDDLESATSELFQPQPEPEEAPDGPYWATTFGLILPAGQWVPVEADPTLCKPNDEAAWTLVNDQGVSVAAFDNPALLTFGRTDSAIEADQCRVTVATMGDYVDDLGLSYTVTNRVVTATLTPQQLFQGQGSGQDYYAPAG